jgi:hypothetical protein
MAIAYVRNIFADEGLIKPCHGSQSLKKAGELKTALLGLARRAVFLFTDMTSAEGRGHAHDGVTQGFCSHFFLGDDG